MTARAFTTRITTTSYTETQASRVTLAVMITITRVTSMRTNPEAYCSRAEKQIICVPWVSMICTTMSNGCTRYVGSCFGKGNNLRFENNSCILRQDHGYSSDCNLPTGMKVSGNAVYTPGGKLTVWIPRTRTT